MGRWRGETGPWEPVQRCYWRDLLGSYWPGSQAGGHWDCWEPGEGCLGALGAR